ncbi:sigma-70 family RNA polymerase sigma factor [Sphingobacterium olei]|uniref:Sigma-70 family RNA polymerase sigma factor n=1 Tax=Sphingobacterium olei TaxID=2571155 RepID=A0A4U0NKK6_9SPHI|nr:sigma-70 family RNA polymerase sigma factor [Sphingobacterium olei]TJZ54780.1 sigma-70 family RNA polymerase sigma factor [Sphingobacterium olei]
MAINYTILSFPHLMLAIKQSDRKAFDELYGRTWKSLYKQAVNKLNNEDLAKDIIQDIFIDLWTKRESSNIDHIEHYLSRAVKFKVIDQFRKKDFHLKEIEEFVDILEDSEYADSKLLDNELREIISTLADRLPQKRREIFKLKFEQELSTKEISDLLNISPKTVQNQTLNSISILKNIFQKILFILFILFFGS